MCIYDLHVSTQFAFHALIKCFACELPGQKKEQSDFRVGWRLHSTKKKMSQMPYFERDNSIAFVFARSTETQTTTDGGFLSQYKNSSKMLLMCEYTCSSIVYMHVCMRLSCVLHILHLWTYTWPHWWLNVQGTTSGTLLSTNCTHTLSFGRLVINTFHTSCRACCPLSRNRGRRILSFTFRSQRLHFVCIYQDFSIWSKHTSQVFGRWSNLVEEFWVLGFSQLLTP